MIFGRSVKTMGLVPAKYLTKVFTLARWSSVAEVKPRESSFTANWMSDLMLLKLSYNPTIQFVVFGKKKFLRIIQFSKCIGSSSRSSCAPTFQHVKLFKHFVNSMQEVGMDISMESSRRVMQRPRKLIEVPGSSTPPDLKHNSFWSSENKVALLSPKINKSST